MAELQASDDTKGLADVGGSMFDATPTTVLDEAGNGGGFTKLNQPTGAPVKKSMSNPGLRGYYNDHDADDKNLG